MIEWAEQVLGALQAFLNDVHSDASMPVFFGSVLLWIIVFFVALSGDWKWGVAAIPLTGWFGVMLASILAESLFVIIAVVVTPVVVVLEVFYVVGPFRVSGWAWAGGRQPKTPRKIFAILVIPAAAIGFGGAIISYLCGYLIIVSRNSAISGVYRIDPWSFNGWQIFDQLYLGLGTAVILYGALWGLYMIGVSCFTRGRQYRQARVLDCRIVPIGRSKYRIVFFENDTNWYHVTPSLYRAMRNHLGATCSYTVIRSFEGREFLRRRPRLAPCEGERQPYL